MSRIGRFAPSTAPTGWVFLHRYRADGFTIRWKRGDPVAYVLAGHRIGDHAMTGVLGTIPVLPVGGLIWLRYGCWGCDGCGNGELSPAAPIESLYFKHTI